MDIDGECSYDSAHHEPVVDLHTVLEVTHSCPNSRAYDDEGDSKENPGKGHEAVADVIRSAD